MKHLFLIGLGLFLFCYPFFTSFCEDDENPTHVQIDKNILIIHSYNSNYTTMSGLTVPMRHVLNHPGYYCRITDLDLNTHLFFNPKEWQNKIDEQIPLIQKGYYDGIVVIGDFAYQLLQANIKKIPPKIPVIFTQVISFRGINKDDINVTGSLLSVHPGPTADLAMSLFPERKDIILLTNKRVVGEFVQKKLEVFINTHPDIRLMVLNGEDLSMEETLSQIKAMSKTGIVIYYGWYNKEKKKLDTDEDLFSAITIYAGVPVFVLDPLLLNRYSVIGGVVSGSNQLCGEDVGKRLIRIFEGEKASEIPISEIKPEGVVNWDQIEKWKIPEMQIPKNIECMGRDLGLWGKYQYELILVGCFLFLMLILLSFLVISLLLARKRIFRDIAIYNHLPLRFIVVDKKGKILRYSMDKQRGESDGVVSLKNLIDLKFLPIFDVMQEKIKKVIETGEPDCLDFESRDEFRSAVIIKLPKNTFPSDAAVWISQCTTNLQVARKDAQLMMEQCVRMLEAIDDSMIVVNLKSEVTMINSAAVELIGLPKEQIVGKNIDAVLILQNYLSSLPVSSQVASVLEYHQSAEFAKQTEVCSFNGAHYHVVGKVFPIVGCGDVLTGVVLLIRNMTEQDEKNEMLKERNALLEATSKMADMTYFICDEHLHVSRVLADEKYWPRFNGIPIPYNRWMVDEDAKQFNEKWSNLLNDSIPVLNHQFAAGGNDFGELRYFEMVAKKFQLNNGMENEIIGCIREITEHKKQENKHDEVRLLLKSVMDNHPGIVFIKNADDDFRYILCNREFERFFGMESKDIIGKNDFELFGDPNFSAECRSDDLLVLYTKSVVEKNSCYKDAQGKEYYCNLYKRFLMSSKGEKFILGMRMTINEKNDKECDHTEKKS